MWLNTVTKNSKCIYYIQTEKTRQILLTLKSPLSTCFETSWGQEMIATAFITRCSSLWFTGSTKVWCWILLWESENWLTQIFVKRMRESCKRNGRRKGQRSRQTKMQTKNLCIKIKDKVIIKDKLSSTYKKFYLKFLMVKIIQLFSFFFQHFHTAFLVHYHYIHLEWKHEQENIIKKEFQHINPCHHKQHMVAQKYLNWARLGWH